MVSSLNSCSWSNLPLQILEHNVEGGAVPALFLPWPLASLPSRTCLVGWFWATYPFPHCLVGFLKGYDLSSLLILVERGRVWFIFSYSWCLIFLKWMNRSFVVLDVSLERKVLFLKFMPLLTWTFGPEISNFSSRITLQYFEGAYQISEA